MTRRSFPQFLAALILHPMLVNVCTQDTLIKPQRLQTGDRVGLIAPGSPVPSERIDKAMKTVEQLGLVPVLGQHATKAWGYLAGTDSERITDLHQMFIRSDIQAIWCLRGGYGCTRLLPLIDYDLICRHPKIFIGYSDVTALHLALHHQCHLSTFHGPVATSAPTDYNLDLLRRMLFDTSAITIHPAVENPVVVQTDTAFRAYTITPGKAQGRLIGGNLSLLAALAGTPWSPSYRGKLVFMEDIGEKPYRIDRMLVQLLQSTDIAEAAGFILGVFNDCQPEEGDRSLTLEQTLRHQFSSLGVPSYYGFSFGHIENQCTLPLGAEATFDTSDASIILHDSAVT